jgi:hypothetical protein
LPAGLVEHRGGQESAFDGELENEIVGNRHCG